MMKSIRTLGLGITLLGLLAGLTGCGGGGGGGPAEASRPLSITVEIQDSSLLTNGGEITYQAGTDFATNITITVRNSDGTTVINGTAVALSVSNSSLGLLSSTNDLFTQDDNINLATSAGIAQAVFHTRELTGTVQLTAAVFDAAANQNVSRSASIDIAQGPPPVRRITLTATKATVPARPQTVPVFFDSPYLSEINIEYRERDGTLGAPVNGELGVAINPVSLAAFSTLDDPETEDVNEFLVLVGNGPVELAGGRGKIFVHPFDTAGTVSISVSGQDNTTGQVFDATFEVRIVEPASDGRPANVQFLLPGTPQYIQGSGGINAQSFQVFVTDGGEEPVPNPGTNNNVFLQIIGEQPHSGEVLRGVNAGGAAVEGTSINLATTSGVTSASLVSGTEPGEFRLRAVVDAADNNVSNGIQGPVEAEVGIAISDGVPYSITLSTFPINSLSVNPVAPGVGFDENGFPLDPNATYSLRVSALVTDRFGNPPAQPTALQLGLVDSPLIGFPDLGPGFFGVSGGDGNPTEGGTSFFAPSGAFQTGGGGLGPNDTLILFGKDVTGNADLESARTITQIVNQTNLVVDEPFNRNDTTGSPVNNGSVIPYLAGRAQTANIESNVLTDAVGVANSFLNYPVSQLGRAAAIYIQGTNGPISGSGFIRTFADAAVIRYPGLAPAVLTATPNQIAANSTTSILLCYSDAAAVPIQGQFIGFAFSLISGQGTVDGVPGGGVAQQPTGGDGCTVAVVTTSGILPEGASDNMLTFFVGGATAPVEIAEPGEAVLQAQPSAILGNGTRTILLRLLDSGGNGVQGAPITGACTVSEGSAIITQQPGLTDANGETQAVIQTSGIQVCSDEATGSVGSCTFEAAGGNPSAIVEIFPQVFTTGIDFSPAGPNCEDIAPGP